MLNCNCASTMLLMMFFAKLLDKSQTPAKSTYLWNMFQRISAEATAQAYAAGQHGLRIDVHGTAGHHVLILQPNGMVLGVQDFLSSLHASVLESWRKVWGNMYSDALVSGPWQGELVFLDVLAFVLNAAKVRRSRNMPPWKNQSLTALQQLRTTFFQILHGAMAHSILEHVEANEAFERAVPSRRLSGQGRRLAVG